MMKILMLCAICYALSALSIKAQTPTTSIRDAVQQQVQQELANIKQAVSKKAFVGTITTKSDTNLTLSNLKNQTRNITVAPDATIRLSGSREGTTADLKISDFIIAMGDADGLNKLTAKRVLVISQPAEDKREAKFGTITKTGTTITFLTNNETWTARTSTSTNLSKVVDGKFTKAVSTDFKVGSKIVVLGTTSSTANSLTALNIHLLP